VFGIFTRCIPTAPSYGSAVPLSLSRDARAPRHNRFPVLAILDCKQYIDCISLIGPD